MHRGRCCSAKIDGQPQLHATINNNTFEVTICDLKNEDRNMADITEKTENCELVANCDRLVAVDNIEPLIKVIRGQQVMIDKDLATLYGIETRVLNQTVKHNIERFPDDFRFELSREECLRSQIVTLNEGRGQFYGENRFSVQPLRNNGILVREKAGFHGQVVKLTNSSVKKLDFPDKRGIGSPGQTRTVVLRTNVA